MHLQNLLTDPLPTDMFRHPMTAHILFFLILLGFASCAWGEEPLKPTLMAISSLGQTINIDGKLDEAVWQSGTPASDFVQQRPETGQPAKGSSHVHVAFDQGNLYIAAELHDPDPSQVYGDERHRDASFDRSDSFAILIDTYHDHQNGYLFETNLLSALSDALIGKEGAQVNREWDGLWEAAAEKRAFGWSVEFRIPFETIRFRPQEGQTWGIQFRRRIPHLKEDSFWIPLTPEQTFFEVSRAGHLAGISALRQERTLSIKPYVKGIYDNNGGGGRDSDGGVDLRYKFRTNLSLDLTIHTDFAETEVDRFQVNLTRFPLFFPEKREFFLEGKGFYDFGLNGRIQPYFSRRIGLIQGTPVPIAGGGKLTGKMGPYGVGLLYMQTEKGSANSERFEVIRFTRDMGLRSNIGTIFTDRASLAASDKTIGFDTTIAPTSNIVTEGFWVQSDNQNAKGEAAFGQIAWRTPTLRTLLYQLRVDKNFDPKLGFIQQSDLIETQLYLDVRPHPATGPIRELGFKGEATYQTDRDKRFLYRSNYYRALADFKAGHFALASWDPQRERLPSDFTIRSGITIPSGYYDDEQYHLLLVSDQRRSPAGSASMKWGGFYGGKKNSFKLSLAFAPAPGLKLGSGWGMDAVALPQGSFVSQIIEGDIEWSATTRALFRGLIQWDKEAELIAANFRFSWEYRPGAHLFFIANPSRQGHADTLLVIAKITYLWEN